MFASTRSIPLSTALLVLIALALALPRPAGAQVAMVSGMVKEHVVQPGDSAHGTIRLWNQGTEPRSVRLYQRDYFFSADGTNQFGQPGTLERSNADWLVVRPMRVRIEPGERVSISYRIAVPDSGIERSLVGTYWSLVMVEIRNSEPVADSDAEPGVALGTQLRYGVQIATHVGRSGERGLTFANQSVTAEEGSRHFVMDVANTGTLALRPEMTLELYGSEGQLIVSTSEQRGLIYPGTSVRQAFDLGDLPPGTYEAMVLADPGVGDILAGQYGFDVAP